MELDPLSSMRCWAVEFEIGGRTYEVPALPAVDWWPVLSSASPENKVLDIMPSRLGESDDLDNQLLTGEIDAAELRETLIQVVEDVAGRSLHVARVLVIVAEDRWDLIGPATAQAGFRWDVQPIGAALDLIYGIVMSGLDKDGQAKFTGLLGNESLSRPGEKRQPSKQVVREFEAMAGPRPAPRPIRGRAGSALPRSQRSSAGPSGGAPPKTPPPPRQRRRADRSGEPS
jgi:hypothetical protein